MWLGAQEALSGIKLLKAVMGPSTQQFFSSSDVIAMFRSYGHHQVEGKKKEENPYSVGSFRES
jgi:hypothetical protein